ncbi:MAG TPA: glutathione S-transferase family protein [Salinisphaeraceae bacterium]|nr:glutathione S-transferase family protein [Salinisphaeraceae bacterium]
MLTLYHSASARSFRVLWTLEEMALDYRLLMVAFPPRVQQPDYLQINPLGTVPTFFDGDLRLTESAAICHYLVSRHGPSELNVTPAEEAYGAFLNWLHFGEATLTFPQTLVLRYGQFEPQERRQPQVVTDYTRWFLARLRAIEATVSSADWLCAERFTAADIVVGYALMLASELGLAQHFKPATAAYWQRLQQRPAFVAAMARQAGHASPIKLQAQ